MKVNRPNSGMVGLAVRGLAGAMLTASLLVGCSGGSSNSTSTSAQANLPPDPGPAGMATLAGVDSNGNAVRDDIERYIALTYPADTDVGTRAALTQITKAAQAGLSDASDQAASLTHTQDEIRGLECLMFQRPDDYYPIFVSFRAEILNTMDRSKAYLLKDQQVASGNSQIPILPADQLASACTAS